MSIRRTRIRHRARRRGPSRLIAILFGSILTLAMLGVGSAVGWVVAVASTGPDIRELEPRDQGTVSQIFASDGTSLGYLPTPVLRIKIGSASMPDDLRNATVAVEDRRFYDHAGVDFEGVIRAAVRNMTSGKTVEGGSTLTMQLVRNLYAGDERSYTRKIREAKLAEELENVHSGEQGKRWILTTYLNNVPYGTAGGQELVGVQAAAKAFFKKSAKDLDLAESALIAGLPQAPTSYNPYGNPSAAKARRNDVLSRMAQQGYITAEEAQEAQAEPLGLTEEDDYFAKKRESYVFDYVKKQLIAEYGKKAVQRGGLKVYTTIDLKLQQEARAAIAQNIQGPGMPRAAIVTLDNATGRIKAMASSARYSDRKFNLATQGLRQPGSTFKTVALMAAVRKGVRPEGTSYVSKPLDFGPSSTVGQRWGPFKTKTYDGTYGGSMNLVRATLRSDNSVYMQLALDIGPETVKRAAVDMGIPDKRLFGRPAESLGGLERGITVLESARAYSVIANGGYRIKPTAIDRVEFPKSAKWPNGKTFDLGNPKRTKKFRNGVTGEVTKILDQNVDKGTGTKAQLPASCPAAGKTGTTDNFKDAWFAGFTPKLTTSVWVGYPEGGVEMRTQYQGTSVAGGTFPAAIWGTYMKAVTAGTDCGSWRKITEPIEAPRFTGKLARSGGGSSSSSSSSSSSTSTGGGQAANEPTSTDTGSDTGSGATGGGGAPAPKGSQEGSTIDGPQVGGVSLGE